MRTRSVLQVPLLLLTMSALWANAATAMPQATDARVRETLPGRSMTAGYVTLRNTADTTMRLLDASAAEADRVEVHNHLMVDGMMRMRRVEGVDIEAGATVNLQPGGLHLMFFDVEPLRAGDTIEVTLRYADGTRQPLTFEVVSPLQTAN